ncbi:MAG: tetratricopeptide repeat protein [Myxococcales bacterium]|nr:tetratricopeptide repeat protein [Myxococcales bacterium]
MRSATARLKERIDVMDKRYAEANMAMDRMRQVLDEATALLSRNSADLGTQVERQGQELNQLHGKLEELRYLLEQLQTAGGRVDERLSLLEQNQQKIVDKVAPAMPDDKDALWAGAQEKLKAADRAEARRYLREFVKRFPQDPRGAAAYILVGKSFAEEGKHTQAAAEFQKVLEAYPKSSEIPEAMFQLGLAFVELKFCGDAEAIFLDLAKRYRRSPRAQDAREQAKSLKSLEKDKSRCTS